MTKTNAQFKIKESPLEMEGHITITKTCSITGKILETQSFKNRIMLGTNTGKNLIMDRLAGDNSYSLNILYGEIGTGSTTPADGDVALATPSVREPKTTAVVASNVATFQFFFPNVDLPNGTYNEFGSFVDGSATIGTGQIFNRALFASPYAKASNEDTTVQLAITII
jgi:hypothetical protein